MVHFFLPAQDVVRYPVERDWYNQSNPNIYPITKVVVVVVVLVLVVDEDCIVVVVFVVVVDDDDAMVVPVSWTVKWWWYHSGWMRSRPCPIRPDPKLGIEPIVLWVVHVHLYRHHHLDNRDDSNLP